MKPIKYTPGIIVGLSIIVGIILFGPIQLYKDFMDIMGFMGFILGPSIETKMQQPSVYEPVGKTLALYCQSYQKFFPDELDYAWFPKELIRIGFYSVEVFPERAFVSGGSRDNYCSYRLKKDKNASSADTNIWNLYFYSDRLNKEIHLSTFTLPASKRLSPDQLLSKVLAGYNREISSYSIPINTDMNKNNLSSVYIAKIETCLRFGEAEMAYDNCKEWIKLPVGDNRQIMRQHFSGNRVT